MTDWLTTNPRHRNERLTVFSAASNKRRHSCTQSLTLSGARLLGWLACDGFQTFLVLMILSAGQQKGPPSSWHGLPLCRGRSSWMVRVRGRMQVCGTSWNRGSTWWWQVGSAGVAYVSWINDMSLGSVGLLKPDWWEMNSRNTGVSGRSVVACWRLLRGW